MKISYNWLKWYVPEIPAPEKLADVLTYHLCEVGGLETWHDDTIFDLNILPNRAHDLLSHQGVAKELSRLLKIPYVDPSSMYKIPESGPTDLKVNLETDTCRRYMARIIRGVKVGPSPDWVVKHLESIGQKSISNIVDATNITMFNIGQPTHAFDLNKVKGNIMVRNAKAGESMTTLDGKEVEFIETDRVIADDEGVLAIAGVKGGTKAEVDEHTTEVLLEVANFDPIAVRKTARRLGLQTDASKRFENDFTPELASYAMTELSALFAETFSDATFEAIVDEYPTREKFQEKRSVVVTLRDVNKILGVDLDLATMTNTLLSLGFAFSETNEIFTVIIPPERLDISIREDIVEEVGRYIGYDKVVPVMPKVSKKPLINEMFAKMFAARKYLIEQGYSEVMTYTFTKKGEVEVARGAKGKESLRTNLSAGVKESYEMNRLNAGVLGMDDIKIFEIGTVFPKTDREEICVAVADKKGIKETTLDEFIKENKLDVTSYNLSDNSRETTHFAQWSSFPSIIRDIAVLVLNEIPNKELEDILKEAKLLARPPRLVDVYQKDYQTSYAYRLVFQSHEKTLTDDEVLPIMEELYRRIKEKGWEIR